MQTKLLLPRGFGPAQPLFPTSTSPACGVPGGGGEEAETGGATSSHLPFKEAPSSPFKEAPPRRAGQALCMKLLGLCGLTQPTFNCFQAAAHFPTQSCTRPAQCPQPRWTKQRVPTAEASPAWPLCAPAPGDLALSKQVQGLHVSVPSPCGGAGRSRSSSCSSLRPTLEPLTALLPPPLPPPPPPPPRQGCRPSTRSGWGPPSLWTSPRAALASRSAALALLKLEA